MFTKILFLESRTFFLSPSKLSGNGQNQLWNRLVSIRLHGSLERSGNLIIYRLIYGCCDQTKLIRSVEKENRVARTYSFITKFPIQRLLLPPRRRYMPWPQELQSTEENHRKLPYSVALILIDDGSSSSGFMLPSEHFRNLILLLHALKRATFSFSLIWWWGEFHINLKNKAIATDIHGQTSGRVRFWARHVS